MAKSKRHQQAGKIGAHTKWANTEDRSAATAPARAGLQQKFEDQVDPDRVLPLDERTKRAESARRAYYQRLAMKSAESRRAKRATPGEEVVRRPPTERRGGTRPAPSPGPAEAATSPGHEEGPQSGNSGGPVPKGKFVNETERTTPAPESATHASWCRDHQAPDEWSSWCSTGEIALAGLDASVSVENCNEEPKLYGLPLNDGVSLTVARELRDALTALLGMVDQ